MGGWIEKAGAQHQATRQVAHRKSRGRLSPGALVCLLALLLGGGQLRLQRCHVGLLGLRTGARGHSARAGRKFSGGATAAQAREVLARLLPVQLAGR
jgi:hypothetical protein